MRLARVKGTALSEVVRAAREQGEALHARLSPRTRELLEGTVLAGSWYPEPVLRELLEAQARDDEARRGLGHAQASKDLAGVYRSLFKAGDWVGTLSTFPMVWSLYHDSGAGLFQRHAPDHVSVTVRGFALPSAALCAFTSGWLQGAAELAGGQGITLEQSTCRVHGADRCIFDMRSGA